MYPDVATLYLAGIEDEDYKNDKIGCKVLECRFEDKCGLSDSFV